MINFKFKKLETKKYSRHSGYPGGYKEISLAKMLETHPERVIEKSVKLMLPKNKLGAAIFSKLKVYKGPEHNQTAQKPQEVTGC